MATGLCGKELSPRRFRVQHQKPAVFVQCQWQRSEPVSPLYLGYRVLAAAVFLVILVCSVCDVGRSDSYGVKYVKWGIYLTNWGWALCTLQAALAALLVTRQLLWERNYGTHAPVRTGLPVGYRVYWVCHTVSVVVAFGITASYWIIVYGKDKEIDPLNIILHALNSAFMLTDLLLVKHPFRLLHFYLPFIFLFSYMTFTLIYFLLGGTDRKNCYKIYAPIDWKNPGRAVLAIGESFVYIFLAHCFAWVFFLLRRWIARCIVNKNHINILSDACEQIDEMECSKCSVKPKI